MQESDRKRSTKENLLTTITVLQEFRPGFDFKDITYTFLRDFEVHLKEKGNSVNTIAKHLRQLRTLVSEAINQGYIPSDAYPFRKFKIKQEKGRKEFLTLNELRRLENLLVSDKGFAMYSMLSCFVAIPDCAIPISASLHLRTLFV